MRIGMVSPYSLSSPGGVQGQILGLARALRARGESVRVLGPCDGPPPEAFVTPLGNSWPTGTNGSIAPLAPDPAAQLRTIRAVRDEDFDVLHLHEPICPGPTMTALLVGTAPIVATFHRAGASRAYRVFKPLTFRGARRLGLRFAVSDAAEALVAKSLGGTYERAFNGVEIDRFRPEHPAKTDGPTVLFLGRHEERKGLAVLLEAFASLDSSCRLWIAGQGPETETLKSQHAGDPRISWLGQIDEDEKFERLAGADVFCAPSLRGGSGLSCSKPWRLKQRCWPRTFRGIRRSRATDEMASSLLPAMLVRSVSNSRCCWGTVQSVTNSSRLVHSGWPTFR